MYQLLKSYGIVYKNNTFLRMNFKSGIQYISWIVIFNRVGPKGTKNTKRKQDPFLFTFLQKSKSLIYIEYPLLNIKIGLYSIYKF